MGAIQPLGGDSQQAIISTYKSGKKHEDWFKKKKALELEVLISGLVIREGRVASLVMAREGAYWGRVSLGLDARLKDRLLAYGNQQEAGRMPFSSMPAELRGERVLWLSRPFAMEVTGLELTDGGLLRHPKLLKLHESRLEF